MQTTRQTFVIDTKVEGNTIVITRNIEDAFDMLPFLKFSKEEKTKILGELNAKLRRLSFSEAAQKIDIELALRQVKPTSDFLNSIYQNEKAFKCLVNLIAYGKYIYDYKGDNKSELAYRNIYKENLKQLQMLLGGDVKDYLQVFSAAESDLYFLRVISLAYFETASRELSLDDFRASELMGHNIAYKVAENEGQLKNLVIKTPEGKKIESFSIREIEVKKTLLNGEQIKDNALIGSILVPEYSGAIPDEPVMVVAWAGTHNPETIKADFQAAAGEESYRCGEDQIMRQVVEAIQQLSESCQKPVKVIFTGHSLGGALAQLSYHSLQRVLALSIKDPAEIQMQVIELEAKFNDGLDRQPSTKQPEFFLFMNQQSLHGVRLPIKSVSAMSVDIWSDADVLKPVEDSSNALSLLLTKYANISQSGNFGRVGGGDLDYRRQGTILSKAGENGAKIRVLKVETDFTGVKTTMLGPATGAVVGSIALPLIGMSLLSFIPGALLGAAITTAMMVNAKWDAHSKRHFEGSRPLDPYRIYTSHHPDGSLNEDTETGFKKIQEELASKTSVVDKAINYASNFADYSPRQHSRRKYHESRFDYQMRNAERKDLEEGNGGFENVSSTLVTEMTNGTVGANYRVIKTVNDKKLINKQDKNGLTLLHHAVEKENKELASNLLSLSGIDVNVQDKDGKTALHRAIEKRNYELAEQILRIENVDVNLQDAQGNTPLLLLMTNINTALPASKNAYIFGAHLLTHEINLSLKNKKNESVENIFKTWNWSGLGSARIFCSKLTESLSERQQPMKNMFTFFHSVEKTEPTLESVYAAQQVDPAIYEMK